MNNVTANTSHSGKRCFAVAQHDKEGVRLECGVGLVVLGIDASLALCMTKNYLIYLLCKYSHFSGISIIDLFTWNVIKSSAGAVGW